MKVDSSKMREYFNLLISMCTRIFSVFFDILEPYFNTLTKILSVSKDEL